MHIEQIVSFFLNLFRIQCGDPDIEDSSCKFKPVSSDPGGELVYDLSVKCGDTWKTRRMSVRQLGEQVESKSTCYKVIYDDQLVIKIPAQPIQDFKQYLDSIHNERLVSLQIFPEIKSLSPTLSAILVKIPGLMDEEKLNDPALEDKYVRLLTNKPRLQNYIKIGDSFVFFMNLSKNIFLNQVIERIHEEKERIQKEIIKNIWLLDSLDAFETIYGEDNHDLFFSIKSLYEDFEAKTNDLLNQLKIFDLVPEYKKKEWFFSILAHDTPDIDEKELSKEFNTVAQNVFEILMTANKKTVSRYRKTVKTFVRQKIFEKNKKGIEGLIINLLYLVYHLKNKTVSVRDLKPDNIYLAPTVEGALYQFWDHQSYSLGLIDLETAVKFNPSDQELFDQPLLAGTPSFMTPAHVFKNKVLASVFGPDIRRIIYLQDWFALLSMIFNVVTGKILFNKTAKLIPQILTMKKKAMFYKKPLQKVFRRVSGGFWSMAQEEFIAKLEAQKDKFSTLFIPLPKPISRMFVDELAHERSVLLELVEKYVASSSLLTDIKSDLINISYYELSQYRMLLDKGIPGSDMTDEARRQLDLCLKKLEVLKSHLVSHERIKAMLVQPISCYELMNYLFNRVMLAMYHHTWSDQISAVEEP